MAEIKNMSYRHDRIIDWLLANPDKQLSECAEHFGYTQCWLSQVIHSEMFQLEYQARSREMHQGVIHCLSAEMTALASEAVEASRARIKSGLATERFVENTTKNVLAACGYGSPKIEVGRSTVQQNIYVEGNALIQARERARALQSSGQRSLPQPHEETLLKDPSLISQQQVLEFLGACGAGAD